MKVLVLGGTRFFGVHMVKSLLKRGDEVTIATRGNIKDDFLDKVHRIKLDRTDILSMKENLSQKYYDVVCDNISYCSCDVKNLFESVEFGRYVMTSSISVYDSFHDDMSEDEFNPLTHELKWCKREELNYAEGKRQAECAVFQEYNKVPSAVVRFPYVTGIDDYTKRLYFYVDRVIKKIPMNIDNLNDKISFIESKEAGSFISFLYSQNFTGPIHASANGNISIKEIFDYVKKSTGISPIIDLNGENGPYNGTQTFSINCEKAKGLGFNFSNIEKFIYYILDKYIEIAKG